MALTPEQRGALVRLIDERRAKLAAELREEVRRARDETFGAVAGPVTDTGDEAVADLLSDLDAAEVSRDLQELRDLEAAQARLADGTYGACVDCGRDIELERLIALPAAARCLACQERHERTYAHPGEPTL